MLCFELLLATFLKLLQIAACLTSFENAPDGERVNSLEEFEKKEEEEESHAG